MADQTVANGIGMERSPEEEREFQIREQVRIRMEAQLEAELQKIREKVSDDISWDTWVGTFGKYLFTFGVVLSNSHVFLDNNTEMNLL